VQEEVITNDRPAVAGNDQKIIRILRAILSTVKTFTEDQEDKIKRIIEVIENGDMPAADTKAIMKAIKNVDDPMDMYFKIEALVDEKYFAGRKQVVSNIEGEKQVILSCYMRGEGE
jgi:hypothetical protein